MKNLYFLLVIFGFLLSCESKNRNFDLNIVYFTLEDIEIQYLKGEKTTYPNILTPKRIIGVDNAIIIAEFAGDSLLHSININTLKYDYSFGKYGLGPNEIYKIRTLYPALRENEIWIYSAEAKKLSLYDVQLKRFVSHYIQKADDIMAARLAPTYRDTYVGKEVDGLSRFSEFSNSGSKLVGYGEVLGLNKQSNDIPKSVVAYVNQGQFRSNKSLDKFGVGYLYRDVIEVLDLSDSSILNIYGPYDLEPTFEIDYSAGYPMPLIDERNSYYCYVNTFLGSNYLYVLYSGEIQQKLIKSNVTTPHQLFQLDYKGNLKAAYNLDIAIVDLYVDEDTKTVYGLSNDENPGLVKYEL